MCWNAAYRGSGERCQGTKCGLQEDCNAIHMHSDAINQQLMAMACRRKTKKSAYRFNKCTHAHERGNGTQIHHGSVFAAYYRFVEVLIPQPTRVLWSGLGKAFGGGERGVIRFAYIHRALQLLNYVIRSFGNHQTKNK